MSKITFLKNMINDWKDSTGETITLKEANKRWGKDEWGEAKRNAYLIKRCKR